MDYREDDRMADEIGRQHRKEEHLEYEVLVRVAWRRSPDELAEAILSVLPENAVVSITQKGEPLE